jgi:hypothetical protein
VNDEGDSEADKGDGRFESKYLKAKADLKANIRKQLSDLTEQVPFIGAHRRDEKLEKGINGKG